MYSIGSDESAIKQVFDHFKILYDAVGEERGTIVKKYRRFHYGCIPVTASCFAGFLTAREEKEKASSSGKITLKAGIHTGYCIPVTLNN